MRIAKVCAGLISVISFILFSFSPVLSQPQLSDTDIENLGVKEMAGRYPSSGSPVAPAPVITEPPPPPAASPSLKKEGFKLFLTKEDLKRLRIAGSSGSYNYEENAGTKLPSHVDEYATYKGQVRVKPGWWARCNSNFTLKNEGPGAAEAQVSLDGTHRDHVSLGVGEEKTYNVQYNVDRDDNLAVNLAVDDISIIVNNSGTAVIHVHCFKR